MDAFSGQHLVPLKIFFLTKVVCNLGNGAAFVVIAKRIALWKE
jgi:hypothetical protein